MHPFLPLQQAENCQSDKILSVIFEWECQALSGHIASRVRQIHDIPMLSSIGRLHIACSFPSKSVSHCRISTSRLTSQKDLLGRSSTCPLPALSESRPTRPFHIPQSISSYSPCTCCIDCGTSPAAPLPAGCAPAGSGCVSPTRQGKPVSLHQVNPRGHPDNTVQIQTPTEENLKLFSSMSSEIVEERKSILYRELVGELLYLTIATRPDIAHAVGVLCRVMENPVAPRVIVEY